MPAAPAADGRSGDATLSRGGNYDVLLGEGTWTTRATCARSDDSGYDGYYMAECHKTPTAEWPSDRIAAHEIGQLAALLDEAARPAATAVA